MRKPRVPRKPKKPVEPSLTIVTDILVLDSGKELRADLLQEAIIEAAELYQKSYGYKFEKDSLRIENVVFALPEYGRECYDCCSYIDDSCDGLYVKVKAENPHYDSLMKKYKSACSKWETKMKEYEEKKTQYDIDIKLWEKEQEPKIKARKQKEKARLQKELKLLQKELEGLD